MSRQSHRLTLSEGLAYHNEQMRDHVVNRAMLFILPSE